MNTGSVAVETVLVDNHRMFLSFLENRLDDPRDAEDILQSAFVRSIEAGHTIRNSERVIPWFYRLLRNALADHYRHRAAGRRVIDRLAEESVDTVEPDREMEDVVCRCVTSLMTLLKDDYAELIRRIDLEETGISEVAADTGMKPNNVRVKLHRARRALRGLLERSCGTCAEHGCLDCSCSGP